MKGEIYLRYLRNPSLVALTPNSRLTFQYHGDRDSLEGMPRALSTFWQLCKRLKYLSCSRKPQD